MVHHPKGYDVYDDYDTGFEKVDEVIINAKEYGLTLSRRILPKNKKDIIW